MLQMRGEQECRAEDRPCGGSRHGSSAGAAARAEDYPTRPVRVMVGFPAGSSADITARVVGQRMGQLLGQQLVIENKPGAGSSLAADFVARAPKDGYTLLLGTIANPITAVIRPNLVFDIIQAFAPIGGVVS